MMTLPRSIHNRIKFSTSLLQFLQSGADLLLLERRDLGLLAQRHLPVQPHVVADPGGGEEAGSDV